MPSEQTSEQKSVPGSDYEAALYKEFLDLMAYINAQLTTWQKPRATATCKRSWADRPIEQAVMIDGSDMNERLGPSSAVERPALYEEFLDTQNCVTMLKTWRQKQRQQGAMTLQQEIQIADQFDKFYDRLLDLGQKIIGQPQRSALTLRSKANVILEFADDQSSDIVHQAARNLAESILMYIVDTVPDEIRYEVLR